MSMEFIMQTDMQKAIPAVIDFNFEELKEEISNRLAYYNALVVTEDAIKEAKTDLANLRKLREAIETRRKEVKKQCMAPYNAFEAQVKELTALIDAPVATINGQIKAFDEQEKAKKSEEIAAAYDELVQETMQEIIPLNRILDPKWLNKGTTMKSIREAISVIANRTRIDILYMESTVKPEHLTAVRAKYIETLDLDAAMDHRNELVAAETAFQQREEQRMMYQPPVEENASVATQEPRREAPRQEEETIYLLRLEFQLSLDEANKLKKFLVDNHINYRKI